MKKFVLTTFAGNEFNDVAEEAKSRTDVHELVEFEFPRIAQPSFSLQQALDIWDAGRNKHIDELYSLPQLLPDKKQYFKEQFNIDLP